MGKFKGLNSHQLDIQYISVSPLLRVKEISSIIIEVAMYEEVTTYERVLRTIFNQKLFFFWYTVLKFIDINKLNEKYCYEIYRFFILFRLFFMKTEVPVVIV